MGTGNSECAASEQSCTTASFPSNHGESRVRHKHIPLVFLLASMLMDSHSDTFPLIEHSWLFKGTIQQQSPIYQHDCMTYVNSRYEHGEALNRKLHMS